MTRHENVEIPGAIECLASKERDGEEAWLAARRTVITATDASVILGVSPWGSQRALAESKRGVEPEHDDDTLERFWWGHALEGVVLERVRLSLPPTQGIVPCSEVFRSLDYPWLAASPDALLVEEGSAVGLEEVKTTVSEPWAWLPEYYRVQVHTQGLVLGIRRLRAWGLHRGSELRAYPVEWDQALADRILRETEAWKLRLDAGETFPPGAEELKRAQQATPLREGTRRAIDPTLVAEYQRASEAARLAEAKKKGLQAQLIESLGGAQFGDAGALTVKRYTVNMPQRVLPAGTQDRISVSARKVK